jgi:hypothetical protein
METQPDAKYLSLLGQLWDLRKQVLADEGSVAAGKKAAVVAMIKAKEKQLAGRGYEAPFYTHYIR